MAAPPLPSKSELKEELLRVLQEAAEAAERAHRTTREGATHAEAKPENDKDTRALEQTYLARGQAMRVEELRTAVAETRSMTLRAFTGEEPAAMGALVTIEEDGNPRVLFVAPHGGGTHLASNRVDVVTPKSPLGRAIVGKAAGDDCEIVLGGRERSIALLQVS